MRCKVEHIGCFLRQITLKLNKIHKDRNICEVTYKPEPIEDFEANICRVYAPNAPKSGKFD